MSAVSARIQEIAQQLSPQRLAQLIDFADFLLSKEDSSAEAEPAANGFALKETDEPTRGLKFDWCVGPDDPPIGKTSVELQHEALELMIQLAEKNLSNR